MTFPYKTVPGQLKTPNLEIYTLSYCGNCMGARKLLENYGFEYKYLVVDKLPRLDILQVKKILLKPGESSILYPVLRINESEAIQGYNEELWTERIHAAELVGTS